MHDLIPLLMTRPESGSERFIQSLSPEIRASVHPIYSPLIKIVPTATEINLDSFKGLIFTSSNGVSIAARSIRSRNIPAFCVGQATTATAERAGWTAQMVGDRAETLIANLLRERPESPILHLRGEHSRGDVAGTLTQLGIRVEEQIIYEQLLLPLTDEATQALEGKGPVIVPMFSPRTARQFADLFKGTASIWVAALSEAVAKPLDSLGIERLKVAKNPEAQAMKQVVEKLVERARRVEGQRLAH